MPQPFDHRAEPETDRIVLDLGVGGVVLRVAGGGRLAEWVPAGANLTALLHPKEQSFAAATLAWIAAEPDRGGTIACRLARPNGSWLAVNAELSNRGDKVTATISADDIRVARRAEAQMHQAIEASRQGVVVRTADELLYINDGFARLIGYDDHRDIYALGQSELENFIHPADRNIVIERVRARMAGKEAVSHYELRLVRRDASALWVAVAAGTVVWDGKPASLSWLTDIDERKRAENALIASKEEAEFANRAKTDFLAHMSHELRTPLNAVLGFSEMIASQPFGPLGSPKYLEYADDIHRSGSHLLDLINDVLDLSKIEAGRLELHEAEICLPDLVAECAAALAKRAGDAKVALRVELPAQIPPLRGDERAVKQVLLNLLSNAVKFTPSGGTVVARAEHRAGQFLDLSVSDTGIGMSTADIEVAFKPFGQVDSQQARKHVGTGLGLPLSRSLIRLHGGDMLVASEPGAGTTVTARFPADRIAKAAA